MTDEEIRWQDWNPGLDNDDLTLKEVCESLPGNEPEEISMIVRVLENPKSPVALKGAVSLERHDCIHIVLGRGLLNQDEAFVIGFTMGTSKNIGKLEEEFFKKVATMLYPKPYRFNDEHLQVYELGLQAGKELHTQQIYNFPFEDHWDWTIGELRKLLGIDKERLQSYFREEQNLLPDTKSSKRLPI